MSRKWWMFITVLVLVLSILTVIQIHAQNIGTAPSTAVVSYTQFPISILTATAAVANATTITIPAPVQSGFSNYICSIILEGSNDTTATVVTNATTSSTNFGGWAEKVSVPAVASNDTGTLTYLNVSPPGCVKSTSASTATTFVSPNSTHEAWTWTVTFFQAP